MARINEYKAILYLETGDLMISLSSEKAYTPSWFKSKLDKLFLDSVSELNLNNFEVEKSKNLILIDFSSKEIKLDSSKFIDNLFNKLKNINIQPKVLYTISSSLVDQMQAQIDMFKTNYKSLIEKGKTK